MLFPQTKFEWHLRQHGPPQVKLRSSSASGPVVGENSLVICTVTEPDPPLLEVRIL